MVLFKNRFAYGSLFSKREFQNFKAQIMGEINRNRKIPKVIISVKKLQSESLFQLSMNVELVCQKIFLFLKF